MAGKTSLRAEDALRTLQAAQVQRVPLASITMDADLQPRRLNVVQYGERFAAQKASEHHMLGMLQHLQANPKNHLPPVLLAKVGEQSLVVDGFLRTTAYMAAGRRNIPARVYPLTKREAAMAAKLANLDNRALPLHRDQRVEVRWQQLATVVEIVNGAAASPMSAVKLGGLWGIDRRTIGSMLKHLPWVARETTAGAWDKRDLDPGTGFPYWVAVKRRLREKHQPEHEDDELTDADVQRADRIAAKLVPLLTQDRAKVIRLALQRTSEAIDELWQEVEIGSPEAEQLVAAQRWLEKLPRLRDGYVDPYADSYSF